MMSRLFRTAIIGLGRSDVMILRDAFQAEGGAHRFEWVNADDGQIDLLVVNSFFISSTSIQKIIQQQGMPYLIVDHQLKTPCVEEHALHLPLHEMSSLRHWLNTVLFDQTNDSLDSVVVEIPVLSNKIEQLAPAKKEIIKPQIAQSNQQTSQVTQSHTHKFPEHSLNETITKLVDLNTGVWEIADQDHVLAVADCANQIIWLEPRRQGQNSQLRLPLSLNKINQIPAGYIPVDLKQWLWQLAWNNENEQSLMSKSVTVQLNAWPQPTDTSQQSLLLAACASLKHQVNSAEGLHTHLKMPIAEAQRLITSLIAVKFATEVRESAAIVQPPVAVIATEVEQEEASFFKGFLSKLRNKLGL